MAKKHTWEVVCRGVQKFDTKREAMRYANWCNNNGLPWLIRRDGKQMRVKQETARKAVLR